jgi:two-component system, OmpR family, sensor histidine kinase TctE
VSGRAALSPSGSFSIRRRITGGAFLLLALLAAALVWLAWNNARRAADEAFDRLIGASALSIADSIRIENERLEAEVPQAALAMLGLRSEARVFYRVANPAGASIAGYVTLGLGLPAADRTDPVFSNGDYRGTPVRLALAGRYLDSGWASVIVAETLESREALAWQLFLPPVAALLLTALLALVLLSFGVRRAFRPLALIEDELRLRLPTDLTPIRAGAPREVRRLVTALDEFMLRLQGTLDRIRNYAGHAAHEVRTPIAAIRAQAAAAIGETTLAGARRRLRRIEANAEAAGQIVNQMLIDASVQHRIGTREKMRVDAAALCREVIDRLDPLVQPAVRLRAEGESTCEADAVALREAIRNLVDNALKYAPSGLVEITLAKTDGGLAIEVSDRGPGIPEAEMGRLTERFQRGGGVTDVPGAGLGLHIVRQVAEAYAGRLELANRTGGGLSARLLLKAAVLAGALALLTPFTTPAGAQSRPTRLLNVLASPDRGLIDDLAAGFRRVRPDIDVRIERSNAQIISTLIRAQDAINAGPDLVVSHAADILLELVNDGYAGNDLASLARDVPASAHWRRELFTFALDQGVIVYRKSVFEGEDLPRSRAELARLLDRLSERLKGRVGTYDIGNNSLAYLLATQEARLSPSYWRLVKAFGLTEARLYWSTDELGDALLKGEIDVIYNAVASEIADLRRNTAFAVMPADDYRLAFPRTLFVPRRARAGEDARAFVAFMLSAEGQAIVQRAGAIPLSPAGPGGSSDAAMQPIALNPGLLALRDVNTRSSFLETWLQFILSR